MTLLSVVETPRSSRSFRRVAGSATTLTHSSEVSGCGTTQRLRALTTAAKAHRVQLRRGEHGHDISGCSTCQKVERESLASTRRMEFARNSQERNRARAF